MGQEIRVRIAAVNVPARTLDLVPVAGVKKASRKKKKR
jgi:hypothetical protein